MRWTGKDLGPCEATGKYWPARHCVFHRERQAMKISPAIGLLLVFGALLPPALSVEPQGDMSGTGQHLLQHPSAAKIYPARGKVHKVNASAGTIYITHDPIRQPHLPRMGWPGVTRKYQVHDPAMLKDIKPGMTVDFQLQDVGSNTYHIVSISPATP